MPAGSSIISWVLIIAVFYFFLIMPERKRQKNTKAMISNVKAGDKIVTRGGIYGTIISLDDNVMVITTGPDEVKMELSRMAISTVVETKPDNEVSEEAENALDTTETTDTEENTEDKSE